MTPQRQRAITEIFHASLARTGAERVAFLDRACQVDPSLRAAVDALLSEHEAAMAPPEAAVEETPVDRAPYLGTGTSQPTIRPAAPSIPAAGVAVNSAGSDQPSLVMTLAWLVIGFSIVTLAVVSWVTWFR